MAGNACRSFKRETAVVPAEHVAGIIAIEQAATRKPTQHPAAYLLADAGGLLSRQCPRVEEPDLPVVMPCSTTWLKSICETKLAACSLSPPA